MASNTLYALFGDWHTPYHSKLATRVALDYLTDARPHYAVIHGDFFEAYSVSGHDKNPSLDFPSLQAELGEGLELLSEIQKRLKRGGKIIFLEGNHEWRIGRYLNKNAPKLAASFRTQDLLNIPSDIQYVGPYGQDCKYFINHKWGRWTCTHGWFSGKNPAMAALDKGKGDMSFGHTHALQRASVRTIDGRLLTALNLGWLGDITKMEYLKMDAVPWQWGFGQLIVRKSGHYSDSLISIDKTGGADIWQQKTQKP